MSEELDLDCFSDDDLKRIIKFTDIRKNRVMFATTHHRNTKGEHLEFSRFFHMRDLYNTLERKICIMGGAQIGKTDWLVIDSLSVAYSGLNAFFVLPKFDMRASFVQEKVQRPLNLSPEYKKILKDSTFSRIEQMQFGKGIIKFVGASVEADFVSFSGDAYYIEEADKCDSMENIELGYSRMDQSIYKLERFVSNPTTKQGFIYKRFDVSDQRKWMCPCDKCKESSELNFFDSVVEEVVDKEGNVINFILRDDSWKKGCGRDIRLICPKCGSGVLDRNSQERFWMPTRESDRKVAGYHMPSLISPTVAVSELWQEYRDALEDPTKMTRFYSMRLALPFAATGNKISDAVLENCLDQDYRLEVHPGFACVVGNTHPGPSNPRTPMDAIHIRRGARRGVH
jgi:phage terminase large subunit GpA-like protein